MTRPPRRLQLGNFSFLNCAPLKWGLEQAGALGDVDLVEAPPVELAAALLEGSVEWDP